MAAASGTCPSLRILMLHGFTQSGRLFDLKTKALQKSLDKHFPPAPKPGHLKQYPAGIELVFPTAPIKLLPADIPGTEVDGDKHTDAYGWWRRQGDSEPYTYEGMELGLATISRVLQEAVADGRPFDGVLGFSQGGAAAGMVAALLEEGRREAFEEQRSKGGMSYPDEFTTDTGGEGQDVVHPPLKFAVSYSGFGASTHELYRAFYEPQIRTPMCHFIGSVDTVVSEERSLRLVDACVDGRGKSPGGVDRVIYHPGGHFLPSSQKQCVAALVAFIREAIHEPIETPGAKKDGRVEDMELPF